MEFKLKPLRQNLSVDKIANLHFFEFEKNFATKNDRHPFCELVFVSSGTMNIKSENYIGELHKNQMIIHRPGEMHSLYCSNNSSPIVIIIGFECEAAEIEYFAKEPVTLNENHIKKLAEIVKEGRHVFAAPYNEPTYDMKKKPTSLFGCEQMLKILLEYFLIELIREYNFNESVTDNFGEPFNLTINEIVKYIDDNYLEKISIDELAFLFCTNRATLCKEFKRMTDCTVLEYINQKKLKIAKEKIGGSSKTFTEIAYELNFESIHYFTRFFKKQMGITPKEYRKSLIHSPFDEDEK